jgi:hypothetical protein
VITEEKKRRRAFLQEYSRDVRYLEAVASVALSTLEVRGSDGRCPYMVRALSEDLFRKVEELRSALDDEVMS